MKKNIYAVVHCETCYNKDGIFTGRVDSLLTENGHQHAQELSKELMNASIQSAFRSSLTRTKQTLEHILVYHPQTKVFVDDRIIERDYGELSHLNKKKYEKDHPELFPIYHRSYDVAPPGGESILQVEKRVLSFIGYILKYIQENQANILIVAHTNSIRPIRRFFEELNITEMMKLENQRDQIFQYEIDPEKKMKDFKKYIELFNNK